MVMAAGIVIPAGTETVIETETAVVINIASPPRQAPAADPVVVDAQPVAQPPIDSR